MSADNLTTQSYGMYQKMGRETLDVISDSKNVNSTSKEEANKLFDLINQLNTKNVSNSSANQVDSSLSEPLRLVDLSVNVNNEDTNSLNDMSNDSMLSSPSITITNNNLTPDNGNFSVSELNKRLNGLAEQSPSSEDTSKTSKASGLTKIPRIPNLKSSTAFVPPAVTPTVVSLPVTAPPAVQAPSTLSLGNGETTQVYKPSRIARAESSRVMRSVSKSSCVNSTEESGSKQSSGNQSSSNYQPQPKQRGLSSSSLVNKSNRSLSLVSSPNDDSFTEPEFNVDGSKNVRYVVRHKPKESQVRTEFTIFFVKLKRESSFEIRIFPVT
jgi:hypothetical protein